MPLAIRVSAELTGAWLPEACCLGACAEVVTPLHSHQQVHRCSVAALNERILSLQVDEAVVANRDLMWSLPVEVVVAHGVRQLQLACMTPPVDYVSASASAGRLLHLETPPRATLLLNPAYLRDSTAVDESIGVTARFPKPRSSVRSFRWVLHHLASGGAACIAEGSMPAHYTLGSTAQVSFDLPATAWALRLRGTIDDVVPLDTGQSLILFEFEQASRDQSHRDCMAALAAYMRRYWMPPRAWRTDGQLADRRSDASEPPPVTITLRQTLALHCRRHDVALLSADRGDVASALPTRMVDASAGRLAVQRPCWLDSCAAAVQAEQRVALSLPQKGGRLEFETVVLCQQQLDVPRVGRLPCLLLQVPPRATLVEQRSSYRTPLSVWPLTEVWIQSGSSDGVPAERRPSRRGGNAVLRDISPEGASVQIGASGPADGDSSGYDVGAPVTIWLRLQGSEPLVVPAEVRNGRYDSWSGCLLLGLRFVGLEASPEGRALKKRLERFTADMQRAAIRRMRARSRTRVLT